MDLFKPYKTLQAGVKFTERGQSFREVVATIYDEEIGCVRLGSPGEDTQMIISAFHDKIDHLLRRESSTVIFRTVCGCERVDSLLEKWS